MFRPFDKGDVVNGFLKAEFTKLGRVFDTIKIEMPERLSTFIIGLNNGVSGARDFPNVRRKSLNKPPCQRGFSCAKITKKGDDIGVLKNSGKFFTERQRLGFICKWNFYNRAGRHGS